MGQSGLYLIGMRTDKEFWVKVGMSKNIPKRIRKYHTYNPAFILIDTWLIDDSTVYKTLEQIIHKSCFNTKRKSINCKEWFTVTNVRYNNILKQGFKGLYRFKAISKGL